MIRLILDWLVGGGIASIGKELRQARLERMTAENAEKRIDADVRVKELEAEAAERRQKLADPILKLPLFLSELAVSVYIVAVMIDSTFPMEWLTPLRLPDWFVPHFYVVVVSIFGIAATERFIRRR